MTDCDCAWKNGSHHEMCALHIREIKEKLDMTKGALLEACTIANVAGTKLARTEAALAKCRQGLEHIAHGDPTPKHAREWYSTAVNTLTEVAEILEGTEVV